MDNDSKNRLLAQFQEYLETTDLGLEEEGSPQTDLFDLFSEMSALRNEVKIESRQFKTALDEFKNTLDLLHTGHAQLNRELDKNREALQTQRRDISRSMLLDLLDVYDRLAAGLKVLENYQPVSGWFGHSTKQDQQFVHSIQEGQTMILRKIEQILTKHQVQAIDALHQPIDPHCMSVVEVDHQPDIANGVVVEELRKGFFWDGQVLRLAEVKVNKT